MLRIRIIWYTALAVLFLSVAITQSRADERVTTICQRIAGGGHACTTTTTTPREMTRDERAEAIAYERERDERIAKWESFCKPVVKTGADGISRYTYAHKNCDIGRSE